MSSASLSVATNTPARASAWRGSLIRRNRSGPEQRRIAQETLVGEIARQQHALQMVVDAGIIVERHAGVATRRFEPRETFVEKRRRSRAARKLGTCMGSILAAVASAATSAAGHGRPDDAVAYTVGEGFCA